MSPASGARAAGDPSGEGEADAGIDPAIQNAVAAGQLTAGEWNDASNWNFWLKLHGDCGTDQGCPQTEAEQTAQHWHIDTTGRIPVDVKAGDAAVVDAVVTLVDAQQKVVWQAHTDHAGHAELFANPFATPGTDHYRIEVTAGGDTASKDDVAPGTDKAVALSLPAAHTPAPSLDLMFVVDCTGSMTDELRYLQAELEDVLTKVRSNVGSQLTLRTSVNFYRDVVDDYVVRPFPFTTNVSDAVQEISAQSADGGGDIPEAVDQALQDAISKHDWSANASARLLFLVLDAPPHDMSQNIDMIQKALQDAAAAGVQIIPVVASGADKPTEFLMRSFAIVTGGTYTFLTDDSGIGNSHLKPTIGQFQVELLNELLVRVINERL
jgi:hypothetical protein